MIHTISTIAGVVDDKTQVCKLSKLGKKKNENAETAMKEERDKARANNTEPKEEIIVDLDKSKSKIIKNKKLTDSSESSFEDALNEERERLLKDTKKINIIEDTLVNIQPNELREQNRDLASAKSYEDLGNKGYNYLNLPLIHIYSIAYIFYHIILSRM